MIYIKFPQGKSCHFIFSWTGETNVWFYTMEQPISYHEWSWHQFQRNKSKEETNQVSLAVYKVRIGTSTTCLQTAFVSEDTGLQHFPKLAFNYSDENSWQKIRMILGWGWVWLLQDNIRETFLVMEYIWLRL